MVKLSRLRLLCLFSIGLIFTPSAWSQKLPLCSLAKTNHKCALPIDRTNPYSVTTVQMYEGESVTAVVENPYSFERYYLDTQSGQLILKPDVASSIVQGLLPSLQKTGEFKANALGFNETQKQETDVCQNIAAGTMPKPGEVDDMVQVATVCVGQLATKAIDIYQKLEPLIAPDTLTPIGYSKVGRKCDLAKCVSDFLDSEAGFSSRIATIGKDATLSQASNATYAADMKALNELNALQKSADSIATDLQGYKQRLADLPTTLSEIANMGIQDCGNFLDDPPPPIGEKRVRCIAIKSRPDTPGVYSNMATRTVTYALNTFNLVSNAQEAAPDPSRKKLLANVNLNFAEKPKDVFRSSLRWEASAGAFFSTLPIRSFALAPVFTGTVVTDKKVSQNVLHPTVVPFAADNYRLTNDLSWTRWKSNLYLTGAIGINPNTVSADFATGLSMSWRGLMLSGLCHFGHDVRLAQGLKVSDSLGASYSGSIPTETYWTPNFAVGLSIRVPALTVR